MPVCNFVTHRNRNGGQELVITDDETTILVHNHGSGEGTVEIIANRADYDPAAIIADAMKLEPNEDGTFDLVQLGHCLVWAEPLTVYHAITDVINNQ